MLFIHGYIDRVGELVTSYAELLGIFVSEQLVAVSAMSNAGAA
jgi:hypothetical protein